MVNREYVWQEKSFSSRLCWVLWLCSEIEFTMSVFFPLKEDLLVICLFHKLWTFLLFSNMSQFLDYCLFCLVVWSVFKLVFAQQEDLRCYFLHIAYINIHNLHFITVGFSRSEQMGAPVPCLKPVVCNKASCQKNQVALKARVKLRN